jgi:membrane protease YdiL (CAAX protease family)
MWLRRLWVTEDGMLRAPWRILLFLLIAAIVGAVAAKVASAASRVLHAVMHPLATGIGGIAATDLMLQGLLTVAALLAAHAVCLRWIDKLPWAAAGLHRAAARPGGLAWAGILGVAAIGIPSMLLLLLGWLDFQPAPPGSSLGEGARALIVLAPLAFAEELMLRGYILTVLRKALDWRVAVGLTSIVFGLLHIPNPGSNAASITVVVLAGVLLGTVVVVTGSLYAATAVHLAWNWMMAGVLHAPVSGLGMATPDYRLVDAGPDLLTGGSWGPEGGLGAVLGMGGALVFLYVRRARPREE